MTISQRSPFPYPCLVKISFLLLLLTVRSTNATTSTNTNTSVPTATLSNGIVIPLVGLGCASGIRKEHVLTALEAGYRYLDTAQAYQWGYHEADVSAALQQSTAVTRKDVFVSTKVHPENLGYAATKRMVQASLKEPGFEGYLDAVLIHKPRCWPGACNKEPEGTWQDSWKALEEFYDQGLVKAIGICDVNDDNLLDQLLQQRIQPHIIQNWLDPFHQEPDIRKRIQSNNILFQGYSTLGTQWKFFKGLKDNPVLTSPQLKKMAHQHKAWGGPATVVIQWATLKGISVLPASKNPQRQKQNLLESFQFQLSDEELRAIDEMDGKAPLPDPNELSVTFTNPIFTTAVQALWVNPDTSEEVLLGDIEPGKELTLSSHHGHTIVFRTPSSSTELLRHELSKDNGKEQTIPVVPQEDEEL